MKNQLLRVLFSVGILGCFTGYCFALVDWVQDYKTGVYQREHFEALYETSALIMYTVFAIRFMHEKLKGIQ